MAPERVSIAVGQQIDLAYVDFFNLVLALTLRAQCVRRRYPFKRVAALRISVAITSLLGS
jgi:hypothetical protein